MPTPRQAPIRRSICCLVALAVAAVAVTAACEPEPEPGTTNVVGDSLTFQAAEGTGEIPGQPDDTLWHAWPGWTASDVQPWVHSQTWDHARPETLVVALGINDSRPSWGGWTWADIQAWIDLLDTPHSDTCIAVVLPAVGPSAGAAWEHEVGRARESITAIAADRPNTVIEDWALPIAADPGLLGADGIHLARLADGSTDPVAAGAYADTMWRAAARC